jgi:hypothetical protein
LGGVQVEAGQVFEHRESSLAMTRQAVRFIASTAFFFDY